MKPSWLGLFHAKPRGVFVIIDPMVGQLDGKHERGQLRALPMLRELGIEDFTFVNTWFQYKLVDFNYLKLGNHLPDANAHPTCQFISQDVEFNSDLEITKHLLNFTFGSTESFLVLVVDSAKFLLKDNQDGKPMIEDWGLSSLTFRYVKIFPEYLKLIGIRDPIIPLTETRNLVFHRMAERYWAKLDRKPKRLADLFEYEVIPFDSFAWDILKSFANKEAREEFHPYIHRCLRSWVEKGITRISEQVLEMLQRCRFDPARIEKFRLARGKKEEKN